MNITADPGRAGKGRHMRPFAWGKEEKVEKIIYHKLLSFLEGTIFFGAVFAVILSLQYRDPAKGCLLGLFAGLLFGLGILIICMVQEKKAEEAYNRISEREEIVYYTLANMYIRKGVSVGGRIYLTRQSIRFKGLGLFRDGNNVYIPLACIEDVILADKLNCIEVLARNGTVTVFAVHERAKVRGLILQEKEAAKEKAQKQKAEQTAPVTQAVE